MTSPMKVPAREIGFRKMDSQIPSNNSYVSITADTQEGETFLCWVITISRNATKLVMPADPMSKSVTIHSDAGTKVSCVYAYYKA